MTEAYSEKMAVFRDLYIIVIYSVKVHAENQKKVLGFWTILNKKH